MRRSIRYVIAVLASTAGAVASPTTGVLVGEYAANHGIANGLGVAMTLSILGTVVIPAIIVKKLLVDYW